MNFKDYFTKLSHYNRWANGLIYDAVRQLPDDEYRKDRGMYFKSIHGTLNHNIVGDLLWLKRITDEGEMPDSLDQILYDHLDDTQSARQALDERIINVVAGFSETEFHNPLIYVDTEGVEMQKPFEWIWGHFFNHQTHHRGHIHGAISQAGHEPPELDMTYFMDAMEKAA